MAFQENKPQPPLSERGEIQTQTAESQERRKESLGDKIKRFAGKIGERLVAFSQRKQSAESVMKSVNPEATFTPQEQEQLTTVESAAQTETAKATEALQALETNEPVSEPATAVETSGVETPLAQEQLTQNNMIENESMENIAKSQEFLSKLTAALKKRVSTKNLTQAEADGKLERAKMIKGETITGDVGQAAEIFAAAGNVDEAEMTSILEGRGEKAKFLEQNQTATPEAPKTPEQRMEALKQKAETIKKQITQNLTEQYGSLEAAQTYSDNRRSVRPLEDPSLAWGHNNLAALKEIEQLQKYMEEGHEDYSNVAPYYGSRGGYKTFDSELSHWEYVASDKNISHDKSKAKGAFKETREQQVDILNTKVDALLAKFDKPKADADRATIQRLNQEYEDEYKATTPKNHEGKYIPEKISDKAKAILKQRDEAGKSFVGYDALQNFKTKINSPDKNTARVGEDGKLQMPDFRGWKSAESQLAELEKQYGKGK